MLFFHDDGDCNVEHFVALCPCVHVRGHLGMRKRQSVAVAVRGVSAQPRRGQPNSYLQQQAISTLTSSQAGGL